MSPQLAGCCTELWAARVWVCARPSTQGHLRPWLGGHPGGLGEVPWTCAQPSHLGAWER